ncbi:hypothetical protein ES319_D09G170500v1 [Gossypium barbadense]|uniref:Uncharacterized protein n=2 Tax=Gossypium TaxID=3633 RepID=A0A5J5Q420_GOSBA|nr:hypothetical protein ES319_D09G170500v1 [Gossypium barbadense]TYG54407.1 hypothetical protein ES288_D09G187000v1 [Gossypium darwinii]
MSGFARNWGVSYWCKPISATNIAIHFIPLHVAVNFRLPQASPPKTSLRPPKSNN